MLSPMSVPMTDDELDDAPPMPSLPPAVEGSVSPASSCTSSVSMNSANGSNRSPTFLGFAIVGFHATKGHVIEEVHPHHRRAPEDAAAEDDLTAEEERGIAKLALPDSSSEAEEGDSVYVFRLRGNKRDTYASVFFRQKRDAKAPRGFVQKSVVCFTRRTELVLSLRDVVRAVGPLYFTFGSDVLKRAYDELSRPQKLALPPALVPRRNNTPSFFVAGTQIPEHVLLGNTSVPDVPLFSTFGGLSGALWSLWELLLCGESILVLASTPDRCAQAVLALSGLALPVSSFFDARPYLTMYDADFEKLSKNARTGSTSLPSIIGTTNPFFLRALNFDNVVSLGTRGSAASSSASGPSQALRQGTLRSLLHDREWEKPCLVTKNESLMSQDEAVMQSLRDSAVFSGSDPVSAVHSNDDALRRHFTSLTSAFFAPLMNHLRVEAVNATRSSKPCEKIRSVLPYDPFFRVPLKKLTKEAFLTSIQSAWLGPFPKTLYQRFLDGPHFEAWLNSAVAQMNTAKLIMHRHLLLQADVDAVVRSALSQGSEAVSDMKDRVRVCLSIETSKDPKERDLELCRRMSEHLDALVRGGQNLIMTASR